MKLKPIQEVMTKAEYASLSNVSLKYTAPTEEMYKCLGFRTVPSTEIVVSQPIRFNRLTFCYWWAGALPPSSWGATEYKGNSIIILDKFIPKNKRKTA